MENYENIREPLFKLWELMQKYPSLPVIPLVDSEIVASDEYSWWRGDWGQVRLDKILVTDDMLFLDSIDDLETVLIDWYGERAYKDMTGEEAQRTYDALPWTEVITVDITTP